MFKKIFAFIIFSIVLFNGLLLLYRASLRSADMAIITGRVIEKKITYFTGGNTGRHYSLIFKLEGEKNKIAINLGTTNEAKEDTTIYIIDTSKNYIFYLDPTVPTVDGVTTAITMIKYNNQVVFKASNNLNLYGGSIITILGLAGFFIIYKFKRKPQNN